MKTRLLVVLFFGICSAYAQTTHDLIWERNFTSPQSDLTIEVGDTVRWTWTDNAPHTVVSGAGSTETFSSPELDGMGLTWSYTFTMEGVNPYFCDIHGAGSMSGTISVEPALSIDEVSTKSFTLSPNPVNSEVKITLPAGFENGSITVMDLTGKLVLNQAVNQQSDLTIDVSAIHTGMYLLRLELGDTIQTKRLIIK